MNKIELPLALYSVESAKKIDECLGEGYALMCRAGSAAFNQLRLLWPQAHSIAVCCGKGNNGGDGFVLAKLAKEQGLKVTVYHEADSVSEIAHTAKADWLKAGGSILPFPDQFSEEVIVDALLGIGAYPPLSAQLQQLIRIINQSGKPILALDLPSGLNADTGSAFEEVVQACATITFIVMKIGLVSGMSAEVVGALYFDSLAVKTADYVEIKPSAKRLCYVDVIQHLPPRKLSAHKRDHGHLCIIGAGQNHYSGAVALSANAALRAGAGLVSLVVAPESLACLQAPIEAMCYGVAHPRQLSILLDNASAVVVGPGLSQAPWGKKFFHQAALANKPTVIDADGLNWLAKYPFKREDWILTPHPGEAARLLGCSNKVVQQNRLAAALALQRQYGGVVVLKGAGTVIVDETQVYIQAEALPGLATAGSGDVLAGLIGSLLAQGLSLNHGAQIGVSVHAQSAKQEQAKGMRGMLASDLFLPIRDFLNPP